MSESPLVATIVVILAVVDGHLQVLLVHRTAEPERGRWALPGGRFDGTTSLNEAAARKLVEETGVSELYLEQLFTASGLDERPSVAVAYFALIDVSQARLREGEDWPPAWYRVDALPPLAFENNRVIAQAVERVGAKLGYTNIAYGLLPPEFTLRQLQVTYQAILGRTLDRRNFRKRMLQGGLIEPTDHFQRLGAHRPARLYRFAKREPVFF